MNIKKNTNILFILTNIINYAPVISCLLLLISCIFYVGKARDLWYIVPVTLCIEFFYNKRWKKFLFDKKRIYYFVVLLFFLLFFIYYPFEENIGFRSFLLKNRLPLSGLALVGFLGFNTHHKLSYYLHTIIVTALFSVCYIVFMKIGIEEFIISDKKTELFMYARITAINSHMMFNLYLNMALVSLWYLYSNNYYKGKRKGWQIVYILSFVAIFLTLSISEGRSGFLMSLFVTGCFIFFEFYRRNKYLTLGVLTLFLCFTFFKVLTHSRISENQFKTEPRLFLWEKAFLVISEKPVFGRGASQAHYDFTKQLQEDTTGVYQKIWNVTDFVDSHNQFLQTTMEFGLIGLCLLVIIYLAPYLLTDCFRKKLAFLWIALLTFQSMFDMFITGQFASLFMIVTFMLLLVKNDITEQNIYKSIG